MSAADRAAVATATAPCALPRPRHALLRAALAVLAGAVLAAAFAPLDLWPLAVLCPAVLMWLWQGASPREAAWLGFWFNAGTFAAGTYWLYISIHVLRRGAGVARAVPDGRAGRRSWACTTRCSATAWRAGCPRAACALAARAAGGVAAHRVVARLVPVGLLLAVARLLADRHLARRLRAGRRGVRHQRAAAGVRRCAGGARCAHGLRAAPRRARRAAWCPGWRALRCTAARWTHPVGPPVTVAVVQGAIPQDEKWLESNRETTLELYQTLTEQGARRAAHRVAGVGAADLANNLVPVHQQHLPRGARRTARRS